MTRKRNRRQRMERRIGLRHAYLIRRGIRWSWRKRSVCYFCWGDGCEICEGQGKLPVLPSPLPCGCTPHARSLDTVYCTVCMVAR